MAASDGSRHAFGTDLPGRDHFGRPPVSSRVANFGSRTDRMISTRDISLDDDTARRGQRILLRISLSMFFSALCSGTLILPATAQVSVAATQAALTPSPEAIKQREQELEATREKQRSAAELQQKLKAD